MEVNGLTLRIDDRQISDLLTELRSRIKTVLAAHRSHAELGKRDGGLQEASDRDRN